MTSFAQNRTDLTIIDDVCSKLTNIAENLRVICSEGSREVDEDYRVAQWHSLSIEAMDRLLELAGECEAQSITVMSGMHVKQKKADVVPADQKSIEEHLETYVEARKCCELLAHSETQTERTKKVERLIDPLHMLSEDYAKHFLSHLSEEELARAEETLVAQQARAVLDKIVPAIPPHIHKSLADAEIERAFVEKMAAAAFPDEPTKEDECPLPPWGPLWQYDPSYEWWMYRTDNVRCRVSRAFPQFSGSFFIKDSCVRDGWRLIGEVGGHPSPEHAVEALRGKFMEMRKQAKENQELEHLRVLKRLLDQKDPLTASLVRRGLIEVDGDGGMVLTDKGTSLL